MKIKFTLMVMLLPLFCLAQQEKAPQNNAVIFQDRVKGTSIYLKDRSVIYQKVFTSKLKKEELTDRLNLMLSMIKSFRLNPNVYAAETEFFGRFYNHKFDVSREDVSMFNNSILLTFPLTALVAIQVKDNKYRVTVSKMEFKQNSIQTDEGYTLDYFLKQKNGTSLKQSKGNIVLARALDRDFAILFDVERSLIGEDF